MTATATIVATQRNDVLLVPNTALRFTPATAAAARAGGQRRHRRQPDAAHAAPRRAQLGRGGRQHGGSAPGLGAARRQRRCRWRSMPGISDGRMTEVTGGDLQAGMAGDHRPEGRGGANERGAGTPLIRLRGVTKVYGSGQAELMALKGIDLDIERRRVRRDHGARAARASRPR